MSSSNSGFVLYTPSQTPCCDPVLYWSSASQPAESHGMADFVEKGRNGTSFGWTGVRRGGILWKSESGSKGWSWEDRHELGEERVFFELGNYLLRELSTHKNILQRMISSGFSVSLKILPLIKPSRYSRDGFCYSFPTELQVAHCRWPLWVQRCARGCKEVVSPSQEDGSFALWPALPSLPW